MKASGPRWLKELAIGAIWSAAAVNVFIYTVKTVAGVYKPPPLSAWQGGSLGKGKGHGQAKPNKEGFPEEALKVGEEGAEEAGKIILKQLNPLALPERLVKALGG